MKSQKGQDIPNMTEDQAREHLEKIRWPNGPVCIDCGSVEVYRLQGKSTRKGLIKCRSCEAQFSVTVNTVLEDSHIPLAKWVKGFHMMCASKKGISALQLQRELGLGSYKTAWHMAHRIRYAMEQDITPGMLKGQIQADETYVGGKFRVGSGENRKNQYENKTAVVALVEAGGKVRSKPVGTVDSKTLRAALDEVCDKSAQIVTDDHKAYPLATANYAGGHQTVNHSEKVYARKHVNAAGDVETITTNTAESFFALLKRGVYGTFHQVSKQHLHRYCAEFDFRWNGRELTDSARCTMAIQQVEGKRLMYKQPIGMA